MFVFSAFLQKPQETEAVTASTDGGSDSGCSLTETPTTTPEQSPSHSTVCLRIKEGGAYEILNASNGPSAERLKEFQEKQRLMEEQNKKRKEMLAVAIAQRLVLRLV